MLGKLKYIFLVQCLVFSCSKMENKMENKAENLRTPASIPSPVDESEEGQTDEEWEAIEQAPSEAY